MNANESTLQDSLSMTSSLSNTTSSATPSALIIEGGSMRGIYAAGVLDEFIRNDFYPFDMYFGVSAGASAVAAYLGKQYGRTYKVITDYCRRPEFKSKRRFFKGGHLIDIDWLWDVTEQELPLGLDRIDEYRGRLFIVATDAHTGEAEYLTPEKQDLFQAVKCSAAMPIAYRAAVEYLGKQWLDGGVSDSLPVREAYRRGARRILVVRSNAKEYQKQAYRLGPIFPTLLRDYPVVAKRLQRRHIEYNETLNFIRNPPHDCEIIELCPHSSFAAGQFTTDARILNEAYTMGVQSGIAAMREWSQVLANDLGQSRADIL
ncbi:MAG: patatin family protein [Oleibacter sp.]|nr:patatin family protein [Thalassolituus sp.]